MQLPNGFKIAGALTLVLVALFWGTVGYVIYHFLSKWW